MLMYLFASWKPPAKRAGSGFLIQSMDPRIRIRVNIPRIRNTAESETNHPHWGSGEFVFYFWEKCPRSCCICIVTVSQRLWIFILLLEKCVIYNFRSSNPFSAELPLPTVPSLFWFTELTEWTAIVPVLNLMYHSEKEEIDKTNFLRKIENALELKHILRLRRLYLIIFNWFISIKM
jgi:hypothetical protein